MKQRKIVVEGLDMTTYTGTEDPYHVVGRTYRTTSEAFRDAEYACAIEKHTSDFRHAVRWFSDFFVALSLGSIAISLPIFLLLWLTK
jgi:hypothetical protein